MTSEPVEKRLRLGEDSVTELERIESPGKAPKDLAETIAAFANALGGQIFLGVEDDGTPNALVELAPQVAWARAALWKLAAAGAAEGAPQRIDAPPGSSAAPP
ncbi:ATP-binding protein [Sorangium sp. So ce1036]|uniref:AlbA family DNA-binding domain-containing protein n=1 Tax=Sorangium sp. So ce1036 TaxID=3133328 RepID=UPI003F09D10B